MYTDGWVGGWGGVITSCEVRWMMMNAGRCCYVASFVVVYRWVGGGGGGVITSCEVRWMMMNAGRCCYVASFVVVYRWVGGGWGGCDNPLAAYYIHKNPGLDSVLNALRLHREKTNGAFAPANCFKQPLWT